MKGRVLVVDDDAAMCELIVDGLAAHGHEAAAFSDATSALDALDGQDFDVVLADLQLGDESGLDLCRAIVERRPELPVVVVTAFGSFDSAVAAIRAGAYDFINKPFELGPLALVVARAVGHHRLRRELRRLRDVAAGAREFEKMLGESRAMAKVFDLVSRLSDSDAAVLVRGESGTGKELVARALHARSRYADGPFVAINCAAVPASLLESTLFGHVRGAFTDAKTDRTGLFVDADGGTLFLDEIGEMPLSMQAKLLRVLQEKKVRPVGGSDEVSFDTRIVSATNRDLEEDVTTKRFREDLFYRVAVVTIEVPPLRSRGKDVLLLAQHFLAEEGARAGKEVSGITPEAARKLVDYDWPGNVRQLRNVLERAVALTRFDQITVDDLPDKIVSHRGTQLLLDEEDPETMPTLEELERRYIERVLKATSGNKTMAAKILGVDRRTLYRKLERFGEE